MQERKKKYNNHFNRETVHCNRMEYRKITCAKQQKQQQQQQPFFLWVLNETTSAGVRKYKTTI